MFAHQHWLENTQFPYRCRKSSERFFVKGLPRLIGIGHDVAHRYVTQWAAIDGLCGF
jgi:hypothetical protein